MTKLTRRGFLKAVTGSAAAWVLPELDFEPPVEVVEDFVVDWRDNNEAVISLHSETHEWGGSDKLKPIPLRLFVNGREMSCVDVHVSHYWDDIPYGGELTTSRSDWTITVYTERLDEWRSFVDGSRSCPFEIEMRWGEYAVFATVAGVTIPDLHYGVILHPQPKVYAVELFGAGPLG